MKQRWTYRCYPTPEQEAAISRTFGCVRYVYNWALAERSRAHAEGCRITYAQSDKALTILKRHENTRWLSDVSCVPLQQALRDLQSAFSAFSSKRARHPVFKKKGQRATARYTRNGFKISESRKLSLSRIDGDIRVRWSRDLPSEPSSATIIREPSGRYFVSFVVEVPLAELPATGESIGIDFGLTDLATLSTGEKIRNPKHAVRNVSRLAYLRRKASRGVKNSRRNAKALRAVAKCYEKIKNSRKDALHKITTRIIKQYDLICIETLDLRRMVKNHNYAAGLSDAAFGMASTMIQQKSVQRGRRVSRIDRFFPSSRTCHCCGYVMPEMPISVRQWECPSCATQHDRDINAAKNILAAGQAVTVHGGDVRDANSCLSWLHSPSKCEPSCSGCQERKQ